MTSRVVVALVGSWRTYSILQKNLVLALIGLVLFDCLYSYSSEPDNSKQAYYIAVPTLYLSSDGIQRFACIYCQVKKQSGNLSINVFNQTPEISRLFTQLPSVGRFASQLESQRPKLPPDLQRLLLAELGPSLDKIQPALCNPLFPTRQSSLWMRVEEINVFIDSPTQKRNVDKLEKAYISAIFDNLGRKRHESSSLSDAITWICSDFGVPLSNAWFFKEYNILVFASDESFGGLMETLFSIAH